MRRIERAAYSGVGKDIPGPNNYEPKYTLTKKKLKVLLMNLSHFLKMKTPALAPTSRSRANRSEF